MAQAQRLGINDKRGLLDQKAQEKDEAPEEHPMANQRLLSVTPYQLTLLFPHSVYMVFHEFHGEIWLTHAERNQIEMKQGLLKVTTTQTRGVLVQILLWITSQVRPAVFLVKTGQLMTKE